MKTVQEQPAPPISAPPVTAKLKDKAHWEHWDASHFVHGAIPATVPAKLCVFVGTHNHPRREDHLQRAAQDAVRHGANLLVLPGYSLGDPKGDESKLQRIVDASGLSMLAEGRDDTFCFRPNAEAIGPFIQRFGSSKQAANRHYLDAVMAEFEQGRRTFKVGDKTIAILLCGEINMLQSDHPRHPAWQSVQYDVLVNPTHTRMGRWHVLYDKFAYLSSHGRTAIHCANNTAASSWKTSLAIYQDGRQLIMGDLVRPNSGAGVQTSLGDGWRLVTIAI